MHIHRVLWLGLLLTGCPAKKQVVVLEAELSDAADRIVALESEVDELEEKLGEAQLELDEVAAIDEIETIDAAAEDLDFKLAQELCAAFPEALQQTESWQKFQYRCDEARLVGERLTAELAPASWIQGEGPGGGDEAVLVLFFEVWDPHGEKSLPAISERYAQYQTLGYEVLALTQMSRDKTEDDVRAYIAAHELVFPVGKDDGALFEALGVTRVPAAAVVMGDVVVWRGHPKRVDEEMLTTLRSDTP